MSEIGKLGVSSLHLNLISGGPWYLSIIGMGPLKDWIYFISWASSISASFSLKFRHVSNLSAAYAWRCVPTSVLFLAGQMLHLLPCQSSCWWTAICHRGPALYGFRASMSLMAWHLAEVWKGGRDWRGTLGYRDRHDNSYNGGAHGGWINLRCIELWKCWAIVSGILQSTQEGLGVVPWWPEARKLRLSSELFQEPNRLPGLD